MKTSALTVFLALSILSSLLPQGSTTQEEPRKDRKRGENIGDAVKPLSESDNESASSGGFDLESLIAADKLAIWADVLADIMNEQLDGEKKQHAPEERKGKDDDDELKIAKDDNEELKIAKEKIHKWVDVVGEVLIRKLVAGAKSCTIVGDDSTTITDILVARENLQKWVEAVGRLIAKRLYSTKSNRRPEPSPSPRGLYQQRSKQDRNSRLEGPERYSDNRPLGPGGYSNNNGGQGSTGTKYQTESEELKIAKEKIHKWVDTLAHVLIEELVNGKASGTQVGDGNTSLTDILIARNNLQKWVEAVGNVIRKELPSIGPYQPPPSPPRVQKCWEAQYDDKNSRFGESGNYHSQGRSQINLEPPRATGGYSGDYAGHSQVQGEYPSDRAVPSRMSGGYPGDSAGSSQVPGDNPSTRYVPPQVQGGYLGKYQVLPGRLGRGYSPVMGSDSKQCSGQDDSQERPGYHSNFYGKPPSPVNSMPFETPDQTSTQNKDAELGRVSSNVLNRRTFLDTSGQGRCKGINKQDHGDDASDNGDSARILPELVPDVLLDLSKSDAFGENQACSSAGVKSSTSSETYKCKLHKVSQANCSSRQDGGFERAVLECIRENKGGIRPENVSTSVPLLCEQKEPVKPSCQQPPPFALHSPTW